MKKTKNPDFIARIRLEWTIGFASLLIAAGSFSVFMFSKAESEKLRNVYAYGTAVSTAVASVASAFYLLQSIRHSTSVSQSESQINRTTSYISRWNGPDYTSAKRVALSAHKLIERESSPERQEEIITAFFEEEPQRREEIVHILNFLEELAIALKYELVDSELSQEFFRGIVISYCETFEVFIAKRRKTNGYKGRRYENLEKLSEAWKNGRTQL